MFWGKKDSDPKKKPAKGKVSAKDSEALRAQAMENVRAARENIGEDTLDRIAAAMTKKQQSATEQAKARIKEADPDRVLDELKWMLEDKRKS